MKHFSRYVQSKRPAHGARRSRDDESGPDVDWNRRLKPGEHLIWSGRPDTGELPMVYPIREPRARWTLAVFLLGLVGVFLHVLLPGIGGDRLTLVLVMVLVGLLLFGLWYLLFGQPYWRRYWLNRTRYALTDRRAIIARRAIWRYWTMSVPVAKMTPATLVDLGRVGHVMFKRFGTATSYSTISKGVVLSPRHYTSGFLFLKDASLVHRRLVRLQSATPEEEDAMQTRTGPVA